jgi:hypothetical protein
MAQVSGTKQCKKNFRISKMFAIFQQDGTILTWQIMSRTHKFEWHIKKQIGYANPRIGQ